MANKSQKNAAFIVLKQSNAPLSLAELALHLPEPVAERTLRRWLATWADNGEIDITGRGKATRYHYRQAEQGDANELGFLAGLDADLRDTVLGQLRDLWTHTSTAIEGNTLTLGDTHFILEEGLTISGKPLKEHQEIIGHASAIELLYQSLQGNFTQPQLFDLHRAVQTEIINDIYKPLGNWKVENNGTYATTRDGQQVFIDYAAPRYVPKLMTQWLAGLNQIDNSILTIDTAPATYAKLHMGFAHIHPFWDGNGRLARLVANIPLLKAGLPPLLIDPGNRREYIQTLADYQITAGPPTLENGPWPDQQALNAFTQFCQSEYAATQTLVNKAHQTQQQRNQADS